MSYRKKRDTETANWKNSIYKVELLENIIKLDLFIADEQKIEFLMLIFSYYFGFGSRIVFSHCKRMFEKNIVLRKST